MTVAGLTFSITQSAPAFTDDPLVAGSTIIRSIHITELRTRYRYPPHTARLVSVCVALYLPSSIHLVASPIGLTTLLQIGGPLPLAA